MGRKREHVNWIEPVLAGVKEEGIRLSQGDYYLYNGTAGIAVFLHAVNKASGKQEELCRAVRNTLFIIQTAAWRTEGTWRRRVRALSAEKLPYVMHIRQCIG